MCGPSKELKEAYSTAQATASTLASDFNKVFQGNQNILQSLETPLQSTVALGPGQFGMTAQEFTAESTGAKEAIAAAGQQATNIARENLAQIGGGNVSLPSGTEASIVANLAEKQAQQQAQAQEQIVQRGYDIGREQYNRAVQEAGALPAELESPATAMEAPILSAQKESAALGQDITAAERAWEKPVAGLIGGALDVVAPGVGGTLGKIVDIADSSTWGLATP